MINAALIGCCNQTSPVLTSAHSVVIPSGKVASNLTAFPLYIDLSLMPAAFWQKVYNGGGNIRAYAADGTTQLPLDVVFCDKKSKTGSLFVKTSIASAASTTIVLKTFSNTPPMAVSNANGRNAVWSDYHRVYMFGVTGMVDRTGNQDANVTSGSPGSLRLTSESPQVYSHQGVAWDGTYYYCIDTNALRKYDSSWNLVASNTNPIGSSGISGVNHCGDGDIVGEYIIVPIDYWVNDTTFSTQYLARYLKSDLSFVDCTAVSLSLPQDISTLCYCEDDGYLYGASFSNGTKLWRFDPSTLAYVDYTPLSVTTLNIQGLTYWRGSLWLSVGFSAIDSKILRCGRDGTVDSVPSWFVLTNPSYAEGLSHTEEGLLVIWSSGVGNGYVRTLAHLDSGAIGAGHRFADTGATSANHRIEGLCNRFSTWTLGLSVMLFATKSYSQAIVSYCNNAQSDDTYRATVAHRAATNTFGLWNSVDGWLNASASPILNTRYRLHAIHNGTTARYFFQNGVKYTDTGCAEKPAVSANALAFAFSDFDYQEALYGGVGFTYLRALALSDAWIAAEVANINSPSTFYSIS